MKNIIQGQLLRTVSSSDTAALALPSCHYMLLFIVVIIMSHLYGYTTGCIAEFNDYFFLSTSVIGTFQSVLKGVGDFSSFGQGLGPGI